MTTLTRPPGWTNDEINRSDMSRRERIDAVDSLDVYEMLEPFEGTNTPPDPDAPYYWPIP